MAGHGSGRTGRKDRAGRLEEKRLRSGWTQTKGQAVSCDRWLEVWDGFKLHLGPDDVRVRDVDARFHGAEYFFNWCQEFENELGNAGVHDRSYWRARVRYVNEFLAQFTAEDDQQLLGNF